MLGKVYLPCSQQQPCSLSSVIAVTRPERVSDLLGLYIVFGAKTCAAGLVLRQAHRLCCSFADSSSGHHSWQIHTRAMPMSGCQFVFPRHRAHITQSVVVCGRILMLLELFRADVLVSRVMPRTCCRYATCWGNTMRPLV